MSTVYNQPTIVGDGLSFYIDAANTAKSLTTIPSGFVAGVWKDMQSGTAGSMTTYTTYTTICGGSITYNGANQYSEYTRPNAIANASIITVDMWASYNLSLNGSFYSFGNTGDNVFMNSATGLGFNTWKGDLYGISAATVTSLGIIGNIKHYSFVMTTSGSIPASNKIYVNGVQQALSQVGTFGTTTSVGPVGPFRLALTTNGTNSYWGPITYYNLKMYSRELSAAEVLQNFNAQRRRFGI